MTAFRPTVMLAACLAAVMSACPAGAQTPQDGNQLRTADVLAVQLYAIGGAVMPSGATTTVIGADALAGVSTQSGGTSKTTPLLGARVQVPMFWYMDNDQRLAFSAFFETGIQSGLGNQSRLQPFQNTSPTAADSGAFAIREYFQIPVLFGLTVPIANQSTAPRALFDIYGGITFDSWGRVLQGNEANAAPSPGFYSESRTFTVDPTVGLGLRMPVGSLDEGLPLFVGVNAEAQFRQGSTVTAFSPNFAVTYYGSVNPSVNLAVMARIGVAFGSR